MPTPSCAPPDSLMLWAAALLAGAGLLVVVALALLAMGRWRSKRGLGALLALALAGWSLWLRSQMQAIYDPLAARNLWDPSYCWDTARPPPGLYEWWRRMVAAQIAPYQRAALVTISITIAFVLAVVVVAAVRWLRNRRQPRMRIRWSAERGRALSLALLAALILARASTTSSQPTPHVPRRACSSSINRRAMRPRASRLSGSSAGARPPRWEALAWS